MYPDVPPDLFGIVYTVGLNEQFYVIVIIFNAIENIRNACSRELVEYLGAERFITCIPSFPEWGVG
ncbi:hypothetical protein D3C87_1909380 [compost metagenome]